MTETIIQNGYTMIIEKEIKRLQERKRRVDKLLLKTEERIKSLEIEYLAQTKNSGNIFSGVGGYLEQYQTNFVCVEHPFAYSGFSEKLSFTNGLAVSGDRQKKK